ncbi:MAG: ExeM/NucH family extracellular endonuclease [Acidobacteriota bacterium]
MRHTAIFIVLFVITACTDTTTRSVAASCGTSATALAEVQGDRGTSPLEGRSVTVEATVTADFRDGLGGFFIEADGDALFVSSDAEVVVGDLVRVSGVVREIERLTSLDDIDDVTHCGAGRPPSPTKVGLPLRGHIEGWESRFIHIDERLTITKSYDLDDEGQLGIAANGRLFAPTNGTGADSRDNLRRSLTLDDGNRREPRTAPYLIDGQPPRLGDTIDGVTGILVEDDGEWMLHPTQSPTLRATAERPSATPPAVGGRFTVANFNVQNYFLTLGERGAQDRAELDRQRKKLLATLSAFDADVLALVEIENRRDDALEDLVDRLAKETGHPWTYVPGTGLDWMRDPIRVGLAYRSDRVETVGKPINDPDSVFRRPPHAQTFKAGDETFTVVVAHLKSKSCRDATGAEKNHHGQGCWNHLRTKQARRLLDFIDRLQGQTGESNVLLVGDLNAYGGEDPIRALTDGGLTDLVAQHVPANERYSFVYGGAAGYLDYALATSSLVRSVTGAAFWPINADAAAMLGYRNEDLYAPSPERSSDHDPLFVGLFRK